MKPLPRGRAVGFLALAIFATARFSLLFAIPPGFAAVLWAPAGLAAAALWVGGIGLWPGVFLGSLAANAAVAAGRGVTGPASLGLGAWIAAGSTLQAALAVWAARRAVQGRDPLADERDLFFFLIWTGPLACLIASTWGAAGMTAFGAIPLGDAAYSWATWWVGDVSGVMFAAPLVLLWAGRGPAGSRKAKFAVTAVLAATAVAAVGVHAMARRTEKKMHDACLEQKLSDEAAVRRSGAAAGLDAARVDALIARAFGGESDPVRRPAQTLQSWLGLGRVLFLMSLTSWVVLTLYGRSRRIEALVELKTAELREQERRLMQAQKMESVGRLAGGIAHEFNNILMGASGLAQLTLAELGPKHPSAPEVEGIIVSIKRASHLVSQLLTYSRRREAKRRATNLNGLVQETSKMIAAAVGRRAELRIHAGSEPLWILADAGQVEQVLLNLCFNARDALDGRGGIDVSTRPIELAADLADAIVPTGPGRYVAMEIADEGRGIPQSALPRLSEPFFTTKPFGEGTGLGLSVVSGIVRQHHGGMSVRSEPGKGTTMTIYWPASGPPSSDATPLPFVAAPRGAGLILIVDDEPVMRHTLERILPSYGYRAISAASGEEGLDLIEKWTEVAAVVMDLVMPGLDGLETYDRMSRARPGLKVLFLSGYAPQETAHELERRGLPFLAKPADPDRLASTLHDLLNSRPAA